GHHDPQQAGQDRVPAPGRRVRGPKNRRLTSGHVDHPPDSDVNTYHAGTYESADSARPATSDGLLSRSGPRTSSPSQVTGRLTGPATEAGMSSTPAPAVSQPNHPGSSPGADLTAAAIPIRARPIAAVPAAPARWAASPNAVNTGSGI